MVKIIREDLEIGKEELYDIIVDDIQMLEIGNNEIKNLNIKNGHHSIMVKGPSFISNKISFDINSGEIMEFICGPNYNDNFTSKIIRKVLFRGKGLFIKKKTDFYL